MAGRTMIAILALVSLSVATAGSADARTHRHKRHHKTHTHVRVIRSTTAAAGTPAAAGNVTVVSFTNGKLTLSQPDGSTVSGTVTDRTEIECEGAVPATTPAPASTRSRGGDDNGSDDRGDDGPGHDQGDDHGDDNGSDDDAEDSSCTTAALVPGAIVDQARLRVSSAGSAFDKIRLRVS